MEKERSTILLLKKITDVISEQEELEFQQWMQQNLEREQFVTSLLNEDISEDFFEYQRIDTSRGLKKVLKHVRRGRTIVMTFKLLVAASLLISCSLLYFHFSRDQIKPNSLVSEINLDTIARAKYPNLTTSDGRVFNLDSMPARALDEQLGIYIDFSGDHQIRYLPTKQSFHPNSHTLYNIIHVPFGRPWMVTLIDSSIVWINGGSIVQVPVAFESSRVVNLRGESFFDVTRKTVDGVAVPFVVKVGSGTEVRVTGTRFNVRGYKQDTAIYATLVKGNIKVISQGLAASPKPGQAIAVNQRTGRLKLEKVDTAFTSSWVSGVINLGGAQFEEAIKRIARAYGYEVVFKERIGTWGQVILGRLDMAMTSEQMKTFIGSTMKAQIEEVDNIWYVSKKKER